MRNEQAAALEGDLLNGNKPVGDGLIPYLQIGCSQLIMLPNQTPHFDFIQWFEDAGIKLQWGSLGPIVTMPVRDRFGDLVVDIKRNHWKVFPPYTSDKNYTDDSLEVLDNAGHVVLQLKLTTVNGYQTVQLQGEWWNVQGEGRRLVVIPN